MDLDNKVFDRVLLAGFVLLAFLLLGPVLTIPLHIPINYNEGWNAIFDMRAVTPGSPPLYPPRDSFVFNNYPPLGFYLVGAFGRFVFGDMILAGRVLALLALLAAAALTGLSARFLGAPTRGAIAAGLLVLLYTSTFYRTYVAMDDPQWLAHAVMLGGLAVLLRGRGLARLTRGELPVANLIGAAVLMVAGGFIKHNLIALPLSATVWLATLNRRAAMVWLAAAALSVGVGLAVVAGLQGEIAFTDILRHRRVFRAKLLTHSFSRLAPLVPMAAVEAWLLRRMWPGASAEQRAATRFVALFAVIATLTGIFQRLGEGVYYNAHFETLVALCLGFGLALSAPLAARVRWRGTAFGPAAISGLAALPLIAGWPWHLPIAWADIADREARVEAWRPVIARVAEADGPAGCILMSVCWWAGKPSEVDVFNLTESVARGGPLAGFQAAIGAHRLAIFEDDPTSFTHKDGIRQMGHDPIMEAFAAAGYVPVGSGPEHSVLLAPPGPLQAITGPRRGAAP